MIKTTPLEHYRQALTELERQGQRRHLVTLPDKMIDFSSNDFLGLSKHPLLKQAAIDAVEKLGVGSTGSRLISGTSREIQQLESAIAEWKGTESALVFNSGYQGNVAILQGLLNSEDWVFWDRLNHASLVDGVRLSGAQWKRYRHLDLAHLEQLLQEAPTGCRKWIITDTLFSMDGNYPDLPKLCDIAEKHGALVIVDEAHASGVFGKTKRSGLCEALGVSDRITLQIGTFSKALGGFGGFVAGPDVLIQTCINQSRGFIYSTALPPAVTGAAQCAVRLVQEDQQHAEKLETNVQKAWECLRACGLSVASGEFQTQIIPVFIPGNDEVLRASNTLWDAGYFVRAIRSPTVAKSTERLRVSISASHTFEQIEGMANALKDFT